MTLHWWSLLSTQYHSISHPTCISIAKRVYSQVATLAAHETAKLSKIRTRRCWTPMEIQQLKDRVKEIGPRWSKLAPEFNRAPATLRMRYQIETSTEQYIGPWTDAELKALRSLTADHATKDDINWDHVRNQLPRLRPIHHIWQTWEYTINPMIRHGRWTDEEADRLVRLVRTYGTDNWTLIASMMGTRTKRQCLERYRWHDSLRVRGRFTEEEKLKIMAAVAKYGDRDFGLIKQVTGIQRTARHISKHYTHSMNPRLNRSPWELDEEMAVYRLKKKFGSMTAVRDELKTNRSIRDMWNHYTRIARLDKEGRLLAQNTEQKE